MYQSGRYLDPADAVKKKEFSPYSAEYRVTGNVMYMSGKRTIPMHKGFGTCRSGGAFYHQNKTYQNYLRNDY